MKKENFTPATLVHGLAFGAAFPEEQRKYPIVCLGSFAQVHGCRVVVCLYRGGDGRSLDLSRWDNGWDDYWRFLGIQEIPEA